jgi:hypothetical protein
MIRNGSSIVVGLLVKKIRRFLAGEPLDASTTAMPTASSRPAFQMPCSLNSTTTSSRCRAISPVPWACLFEGDHLNHLG